MTEPNLSDVLDRAVADKVVGPPRIDAIRSGAARIRRRRRAGVAGAVAAIVAVAGGTAFLAQGPAATQPPVAADPPAGPTRLVGIGQVAVAVPVTWGRNAVRCGGTPTKDTVVIDLRHLTFCMAPRPKDTESIELAGGNPKRFAFRSEEVVEIGGVRAERQRTTCAPGALNRVETCSGAVYFPTLGVIIHAQSSTDAATVDRMLGWVTVAPDRVGVPEPWYHEKQSASPSGTKYLEQLKALGLRPVVETKKASGQFAGDLLDVRPAPGTVLTPGAAVTVVVVG
ncbi:hypothetical protein HPO96_31120 [Kribbella sandramycini]|uniref:PASTA domain-containing protein n=1 Tax=Kribbella sandramycini TaxID=60450 RepID=A0A7Y4L5G0_9ACTN|nr:hypothetical protein [Kribbella sandramycini]MBB6566988.1 hypothetical protein [Kribbella sandramycini]NOL44710.1 hypothetical protein [Kribbella sandramycini]